MKKLYNKSKNQIYDLNDEKYVSFLETLPMHYIEVLHNNGIIDIYKLNLKYCLMIHNREEFLESSNNQDQRIEEIIKNDNMEELQRLIADNGKDSINSITKSFNEVKKMKIPIMNYCIIELLSLLNYSLLYNEVMSKIL